MSDTDNEQLKSTVIGYSTKDTVVQKPRINWDTESVQGNYYERAKQARLEWLSTHQSELTAIVSNRVVWHAEYQRQKYLRSDLSTCLFASTANGARDLGLKVPSDFEKQIVQDPLVRQYFDLQRGGYRISDQEAQRVFVNKVRSLVRNLRVDVEQNLKMRDLIKRVNDKKPVVVMIGEGSHAVELSGVFVSNGRIELSVVDPLIGKSQTYSLEELISKGLTLTPGLDGLTAVTLDKIINWK